MPTIKVVRDDLKTRQEARARQGTILKCGRSRYLILGDQKKVDWDEGAEGLVHRALEKRTQVRYRIKCFFEPDDTRLARSRYLVKQRLADLKKPFSDVLGGAPFNLIESIGGQSRFAVLMKNVEGKTWHDLRQEAGRSEGSPSLPRPTVRTHLLWIYGLVCAVERMEARGFVHADLSPGNLVVMPAGERAGDMALVDFDAYFHPDHPSKYKGTDGFVAPEIWNRGAVGIGSDRVAMAILVQDILIFGDPRIGAEDPLATHYTQEQICALEARADPRFKKCYPQLGDLLDATLRAETPSERPNPTQWREALLALYHGAEAGLESSQIVPRSFESDRIAPPPGWLRLARNFTLASGWTWLLSWWVRLVAVVRSSLDRFRRRGETTKTPFLGPQPPPLPEPPNLPGQEPAKLLSFLTVGRKKLEELLRKGDLKRARIVLDALCDEYPDHPSLAEERARLAEMERAQTAGETGRPQEEPAIPRLQREAAELAQHGDLAGAAALLSRACALHPASLELRRDCDAVSSEMERRGKRRPPIPGTGPRISEFPDFKTGNSSNRAIWAIVAIVLAILLLFAYLFFQSSKGS